MEEVIRLLGEMIKRLDTLIVQNEECIRKRELLDRSYLEKEIALTKHKLEVLNR
jgi:hypothetical protein